MLPAPLFGLVRDHGATPDDFHSIRRCVSGGDKISAELEREFTDLAGFAIEEMLRHDRNRHVPRINPPSGANASARSAQLAPGFAASIRDDDGDESCRPAPKAGCGSSRPSNMVGYWNRPDATAETIVDGWLDTGDLVSADERRLPVVPRPQEADHHPRRLEHLPPRGR